MQVQWEQRHAWVENYNPGGVTASSMMEELKEFAYSTFDQFDRDRDGFVDRQELESALQYLSPTCRERSFVLFLLFHLEEIAAAYAETGQTRSDGISRQDLQIYFDRFLVFKPFRPSRS